MNKIYTLENEKCNKITVEADGCDVDNGRYRFYKGSELIDRTMVASYSIERTNIVKITQIETESSHEKIVPKWAISTDKGEQKIIETLFEKYQKAYDNTKPGQAFPQWFDRHQMSWILDSIKNK